MQSIDQEGKTVEEALEKALAMLDKTQDDVDYEILDEGSKGVLGVGARPILIRVRAKNTISTESKSTDAEESTESVEEDEEVQVEKLKNLVSSFLTELEVNFTELEAQVNKNDSIKITMNTEDAAILIGKHGQTLDSIQYIFNQVIHHSKYKVLIDISSYKEKHNLKLVETVKKIASTVMHSGRRITLKPMTAFERRIVHESIKDFPELTTKSIGAEPDRRVVISLLNAPEYDTEQKPRYNSRSGGQGGYQRRPGGYQQRDNSGGGYQPRQGGYQPREGGNYQPRDNSGGGGYQPRQGGYQPREGGNYQPRDNSGGGYQPRQGGYQPREGGNYQPRQGGNYQPRDNSGGGGYQPRQGGYQSREGGNYQPRDNSGGGYQPRQGGYQPREGGNYQPRDNSGGGGYQPRQGGYQSREGGNYQPREPKESPDNG